MKNLKEKRGHLIRLCIIGLMSVASVQCTNSPKSTVEPAIPLDPQIEENITELISKMTLKEKIGQMTQLDINLLALNPRTEMMKMMQMPESVLASLIAENGLEGQFDAKVLADPSADKQAQGMQFYLLFQAISKNKGFQFDPSIMDSVFVEYKVGSILNTPYTRAQDLKTWNEIIKKIQEKSMEAIGIPCLFGLDQIHGCTYVAGGTLFPQGVNMSATFNRELARKTGEIVAYETRAAGIPWSFSPVLDMGRQPAWPRQWEGYGEDCYLGKEIGREVILGMQGSDPNHIGNNNIASCLKHYFGYGVPYNGLDRTSAIICPQDMREKQFAPFLEAIRNGKALSIMTNSSTVNGQSGVASHLYLTQWLKEELSWDGMIVTDWADITSLYERDHIASSYKEAVKMTINAGVDMAMVPSSWQFCIDLKELVEEGEVPMTRIDDAVRRVLRLKYRLGLFDNLYTTMDQYPEFASDESAAVSLQAAEESIVLLKNENSLLPLTKGKKILVAGPNANTIRALNGGWSYTWQGTNDPTYTESYNTILEAMQNKFGKENVIYEPGVTYKEQGRWTDENEPQIAKCVAAAAKADYIVVCIGENSYCETTGNIPNIFISSNQSDLVKALAKTKKPIVMVLNEGRPRVIADIEPLASAVIDVMLPGNYGGDALANLISGDQNFSGRLSFTYPSCCNGVTTYDYKVCEVRGTIDGVYDYHANTNIQWPLGYGLSYTNYEYSDFKVDKTDFTSTDELTFEVSVKNVGTVAGKESVLLYSSDLTASIMPDNRRLRAFDKVELQPGESKTVTLKIKASDLAFVGADEKWVLEKGDFKMAIGNQILMLNCTETYQWQTPNI